MFTDPGLRNVTYIADRSKATPILWNERYTTISYNFDQIKAWMNKAPEMINAVSTIPSMSRTNSNQGTLLIDSGSANFSMIANGKMFAGQYFVPTSFTPTSATQLVPKSYVDDKANNMSHMHRAYMNNWVPVAGVANAPTRIAGIRGYNADGMQNAAVNFDNVCYLMASSNNSQPSLSRSNDAVVTSGWIRSLLGFEANSAWPTDTAKDIKLTRNSSTTGALYADDNNSNHSSASIYVNNLNSPSLSGKWNRFVTIKAFQGLVEWAFKAFGFQTVDTTTLSAGDNGNNFGPNGNQAPAGRILGFKLPTWLGGYAVFGISCGNGRIGGAFNDIRPPFSGLTNIFMTASAFASNDNAIITVHPSPTNLRYQIKQAASANGTGSTLHVWLIGIGK